MRGWFRRWPMARSGELRRRARELGETGPADLAQLFQPWLELESGFGSPLRKRLFPPARTFWLFLGQALSAEGSCRETLRKLQAWLSQEGAGESSANSSGYCQARKRLPGDAIRAAHRAGGWEDCRAVPGSGFVAGSAGEGI